MANDQTPPDLPPVSSFDGSPLPDQGTWPEIPGYDIIEELGRGAMGVVYKARQEHPQRTVALKVMRMRKGPAEEQRRRFEREAQAAADLSHPGVVTIYEFGETEGRPYFSMEFVQGKRLDKYVEEKNPSLRENLALMQRICEAVAYAHQRGVIHRDLKPSNILVDEDGQPKILDFGLAKLLEATDREMLRTLTLDGQVLGTVPYMAPEQTLGESGEIDVRTDVYALGVILYEMLTGRLPHEPGGAALMEVMRCIREDPPDPPSGISRAIDDEVETIILKALSKEKERRYQSADAFGADIGRYLANEPIEAKRASAIYHLRKLAYRYRAVLIPAAVALLIVIAVVAISFLRIRTERDAALEAKYKAEIARKAETEQRKEADRQKDKAKEQMEIALKAKSEAEKAREAEAEQRKQAERQKEAALRAKAEAERARKKELAQRIAAEKAKRKAEQENYYNVIALAHGKIEDRLTQQAETLLWNAPKQVRGWEWGRLMYLCHSELLTLKGHSDEVYSAVFSPDGKRILTGSHDGAAKIWDAQTGQESLTLKGLARSVAFSPDGKRVVTATSRNVAKIWDAQAGQELLVLRGHTDSVQSVAFSPDGKRLLTGSSDNSARLWDAKSGMQLLALNGHTGSVRYVAFAPDGRRVATASWDKTARIWDVETGHELLTIKHSHQQVGCVAFSPDGKCVATGRMIWDVKSGEQLLTLDGNYRTSRLAFSPDGKRIASAGYDGSVRVWDATSGRELSMLGTHLDVVWCVAFSADGKRIVTGSRDGTAKIWDAERGGERTLDGHAGWVRSVAFCPDGKRLATASTDHTVKVWDADSGRELLILKGHTGGVNSVAFSHDGNRVATGSRDNTAKLWDTETGHELLTLKGHSSQKETVGGKPTTTGAVLSVAFSPDRRRVLTGGYDNTARIWDAESGQELLTLKGHGRSLSPAPLSCVAFSPNGERVVTASHDGTSKIWNALDGSEIVTLGPERRTDDFLGTVEHVAFSPDGGFVLTHSMGRAARIWSVQTGQQVTVVPQAGTARSVAFSPDGKWIAAAGKIWETCTGRQMLVLDQDADKVIGVAFSLDGERLAVGCSDNTARIMNARTGKELLAFRGHSGAVRRVALSPRGKHLATESADNTVRIWDTRTGEQVLILNGKPANVVALNFTSTGKCLVAQTVYSGCACWDVPSGRQVSPPKPEARIVTVSPDGRRLLTERKHEMTFWRKKLKLFDVGSGQEIATLKRYSDVVAPLFSPDGRRVAIVSGENEVIVCDANTCREIATSEGQHPRNIHTLAFSPDSKRILSASFESVKIWDAETGEQIATLEPHFVSADGFRVVFAPDGRHVVTMGGVIKRSVQIWSADDGRRVYHPRGSRVYGECIAFSPDGRPVIARTGFLQSWIYDVKTDHKTATLEERCVIRDGGGSVALSPDAQRVAIASSNGLISIYDTESGKKHLGLKGHSRRLKTLFFSPDGKLLLTQGWDGTAKLWDARTGEEMRTLELSAGWARRLSFSLEGKHVIAHHGAMQGLYDVETGAQLKLLEMGGTVVALSPNGKRAAVKFSRKIPRGHRTLSIWDAETGALLATLRERRLQVTAAAFSRDGKRLATANDDNTVTVWDAEVGVPITNLRGHPSWVRSVAFSPDGKRLVAGSGYGRSSAKIWDVESGKIIQSLYQRHIAPHGRRLLCAAFSPDGKRVATGDARKLVRIWDATTGLKILTLTGHTGEVNAVTFSADGKRLVTASVDKTVRIWDAENGREILSLTHPWSPGSVAFSPDGKRLVTGGGKAAKIWYAFGWDATPEGLERQKRERYKRWLEQQR